jgi:hypothetical protein
MLTLPAALTAALQRGTLDVVHYVKIQIKGGGTYEAATHEWAGYTPSIDDVAPFSTSVDPMTRESKVGNFAITSAPDGWLLDIACANQLKGAEVTVLWGDMSAASIADLGPKFLGTIENVLPDAVSNSVVLSCKDYLSTILDVEIVGRWLNMHPLEIILEILTTAPASGGLGINSSRIDATSFAPTTWDKIEHFVVTRGLISNIYNDTSVSSPVSAKKLIDDLAMLMDGQLMCREDGLIRFHRFEAGAAVVDNWDDDDFIDAPRLEDLDGNTRNRITVEFNQISEHEFLNENRSVITPMAVVYRRTNVDAADDIASPNQTQRIIDETFSTPWIEGEAIIYGEVDPITNEIISNGIPSTLAAGDSFTLYNGMLHAFCGTRVPGFTKGMGDFEPTLKLDDTHLAYLKVDEEIISVDRGTIRGAFRLLALPSNAKTLNDMFSNALDAVELPGGATFRIAQRGCFGTPVQDHLGPKSRAQEFGEELGAIVRDVTIPVFFANAKIARFARGAPKLTVSTPHTKYACQVGDIITLTTSLVKYYGRSSGLDTTDKWEIVGKEDNVFSDEPHIKWTLVKAYEGDGTAEPIDEYNDRIGSRDNDASYKRRDIDSANDNVRQPKWNDGTPIAHSGTLEVETDDRIVQSGNGGSYVPGRTIPVEPNRDTHVYRDERTGQISTIAVSNGATPPPQAPNNTRIGTVVADGTDVTVVRDERNTRQPVANDAVTTLANRGLNPNRSFGRITRG